MPAKTKTASTPALALIGNAKEIEKRIGLMHTAGQSLQAEMHLLACSILKKLGTHNDVRIVLKFINAMPEMARKNSLMKWFEHFGCVTFTEENKVVLATYVKDKKVKLGDAMAKPFWKFNANEGKPYEPIDFDAYIEQQVKKLKKDAEVTKRDHSTLISALQMYKFNPSAGAEAVTPTITPEMH